MGAADDDSPGVPSGRPVCRAGPVVRRPRHGIVRVRLFTKDLQVMKVDARFQKGLHLFNEGEYFECHDVIESLWLETPADDPLRDLYKGVIQAAAAIYQHDRGVLTGALGLRRSAVGYLEQYRPRALGLNVSKMIDEVNLFFEDKR